MEDFFYYIFLAMTLNLYWLIYTHLQKITLKNRSAFWASLVKTSKTFWVKIIIGSDLNTYMNPALDKEREICEKNSESSVIQQDLLCELNLCDIYRLQHPNIQVHLMKKNEKNGWVHSRLDMFLVSQEQRFQNIKSFMRPSIKSDHSLIEINFAINGEWT